MEIRTDLHPSAPATSHGSVQRRLKLAAALAIACTLATVTASAQNNMFAAANDISQAVSPSAFAIHPDATPEYTLGPGDELRITLAGRDDMNFAATLGPDGRISLPIAGTIDLNGMTRTEAARAVEGALLKYYISPMVVLTITRYAANTILLVGNVPHPGLQSYDHQPTLLEAISRGSNADDTNHPATSATRHEGPSALTQKAIIYRGTNQLAEVDIQKLLAGQSLADVYLQRGDVVVVPQLNDLVSILGAVKSPGAIHFSTENTLAVLLSQAGGLDDKAGADPLIRIIDPSGNNVQEVRFKELLQPGGGKRVTLHSGDVIFVPTSAFGKFAYVVEKLSPVVTALTIGLAYQH